MSVNTGRDRRTERRQATRQEIIAAAWELARERGVSALAMRDLGERVGMRAQSLYVYFPSKHAILDAMYAQGFAELLRRVSALPSVGDPIGALKAHAGAFLTFAVEDVARYQLLFQRTVPGFEPSTESYAVARRALTTTRTALAACGADTDAAVDLYTAVIAGLAAQQTSNDPGGDRWTRLLEPAVDMYLHHISRHTDRRPR